MLPRRFTRMPRSLMRRPRLSSDVQIFTVCCDAFAHGANDVANSVGPFAAVYVIYKTHVVVDDSELGDEAYWILAFGGIGIVIGLAVYGYKIIQVLGNKWPRSLRLEDSR